jgi:hypothetical protein
MAIRENGDPDFTMYWGKRGRDYPDRLEGEFADIFFEAMRAPFRSHDRRPRFIALIDELTRLALEGQSEPIRLAAAKVLIQQVVGRPAAILKVEDKRARPEPRIAIPSHDERPVSQDAD